MSLSYPVWEYFSQRVQSQQKDDKDVFKVSLIYEIIYFLHWLIKQQ